MRFYLDESGDFNIAPTRNPSYSVAAGVFIPESRLEAVEHDVATICREEGFGGSEIKGESIPNSLRRRLCEYLGRSRPNIRAAAAVTDNRIVTTEDLARRRRDQSSRFEANRDWYAQAGGDSREILDHLRQLIKQTEYSTRISDADYLHMVMFQHLIVMALQGSLLTFFEPEYDEDFREFRFNLDAVGCRKLSPFEKALSKNIVAFLGTAPTLMGKVPEKRGLTVIDEWAMREHPFEQRFGQGDVIDLGLIFEHGLHFIPSEQSVGIQLADVVANTIRRALREQDSDYMFLCYSELAPSLVHDHHPQKQIPPQLLSFVAFSPYEAEDDLWRRYEKFITLDNVRTARWERGLM